MHGWFSFVFRQANQLQRFLVVDLSVQSAGLLLRKHLSRKIFFSQFSVICMHLILRTTWSQMKYGPRMLLHPMSRRMIEIWPYWSRLTNHRAIRSKIHSDFLYSSSKPQNNPELKLMRSPRKNKMSPQVLRFYSWVGNYVNNNHTVDSERQSLSSGKIVKIKQNLRETWRPDERD